MRFLKDHIPSDLRFAPALDLELKSNSNGLVEGYASTFGGKPDRQGDIVNRGAFARTLREQKAERISPAMLWSHRIEDPIGRWTDLQEDGKGLFVRGQINLNTTKGREAFEHVKAGDAAAFSIGYVIPEGGRKYNGDGSFTIVDADLLEVSIVSVPANPNARITSVKSLNSKSELVDLLRGAGLPKTAAHRIAAGGWPALSGADHQKAFDLAAQIEAATAKIRSL